MKAGVVDIAGITDTGRLRRINQDDWYADVSLGVCAVADGMGGHVHGEEASHLALTVLRERLLQAKTSDGPPGQIIIDAVTTANAAIFSRNMALGHSAGTGMGTTLTGLYFGAGQADGSRLAGNAAPAASGVSWLLLFNVGDSRVYRFRAGKLVPLTRDHTIYREWEEAGGKGVAPPRNIILRALGLFESVEVDVAPVEYDPGDIFLLCSDGLNDMLDHALLERYLGRWAEASASVIVRHLVDAANQAGGEDNITAIIIKNLATESS